MAEQNDISRLFSKTAPAGTLRSSANGLGDSAEFQKLDHNNFQRSSMKKPGIVTKMKVKKKFTPAPMRPYNGEVKIIQKGPPVGAVYAEDLEK